LQTTAFPKEHVNPMRTMTEMQQQETRIATPKKLAVPKAATPELTSVTPSAFAQARRLNDQGYLLMKQGRYDEAVAVLHRAIQTFPPGTKNITYAYALYNLGRSLRLSGHPDVAIPILQERLKYENQREVVARELQAAKREAGEPDSALRFD
jgi:tetratricopeptide (TPR) repeat protein